MHYASATFETLPNEAIHGIADHLGNSSLQALSLVDKRAGSIASSALFDELDLSKRDADELEDLYYDLFEVDEEDSTAEPRLRGQHVKVINIQLIEDLCAQDDDDVSLGDSASEGETPDHEHQHEHGAGCNHGHEEGEEISEFEARQEWIEKCVDGLKSIGTAEIEISLLDSVLVDSADGNSWSREFLPAIKTLASKLEGKVDNIKLWIDSFSTGLDQDASDEKALSKLNAILEAFPVHLVRSLSLNGVSIKAGQQAVLKAVNSPKLEELCLKECSGDFTGWEPKSLKQLTLSWGAVEVESPADYLLALLLIESTAESLQKIILQNINGVDYKASVIGKPLSLPNLSHLQVADTHLGANSILDLFLVSVSTPALKELYLETEDTLASELAHIPGKVPSLKQLKLSEGRVRSASASGGALYSSAFTSTKQACETAGVELSVDYSVLRCDDWQELSGEIFRISQLATNLDTLSLSFTSAALLGIKIAEIVSLPKLRKLSIGITDFSNDAEPEEASGKAALETPSLPELFGLFELPEVRDLQVTLFARDGCIFLEDLNKVLEGDYLPKLEILGGAVMAHADISGEEFESYEHMVHSTCDKRGVESAGMRFMSRDDLLDEDYDSDEELDSASDPELDTIEEEDEEEYNDNASQDSGTAASPDEPVRKMSSRRRTGTSPQKRLAPADAVRGGRMRAASTSSGGSWNTDDE